MTDLNRLPGDRFEGFCHFILESGHEGSPWAVQDALYIQKNVPFGYCEKCGIYIRQRDGTLKTKAELAREARRTFWQRFWANFKTIGRLVWSGGKAIGDEDAYPYDICPMGEHKEHIGDAYSYAGLHLLKEGDQLTIYAKENKDEIVWYGKIKLREQDPYKRPWQEGVERDVWYKWFLGKYPATLIIS